MNQVKERRDEREGVSLFPNIILFLSVNQCRQEFKRAIKVIDRKELCEKKSVGVQQRSKFKELASKAFHAFLQPGICCDSLLIL